MTSTVTFKVMTEDVWQTQKESLMRSELKRAIRGGVKESKGGRKERARWRAILPACASATPKSIADEGLLLEPNGIAQSLSGLCARTWTAVCVITSVNLIKSHLSHLDQNLIDFRSSELQVGIKIVL